ncbi:predicted protein [Histoplasma capsulatum var. duboisii H88]|uniref:Predicted protein n=1 Tax=Ajellomyces capsulatus (strain H88) TaxID=544711 RepID=F0UJR7_AJEC8|nr:predicted protein [Histoplasma capsulatum var. duboisii H88]
MQSTNSRFNQGPPDEIGCFNTRKWLRMSTPSGPSPFLQMNAEDVLLSIIWKLMTSPSHQDRLRYLRVPLIPTGPSQTSANLLNWSGPRMELSMTPASHPRSMSSIMTFSEGNLQLEPALFQASAPGLPHRVSSDWVSAMSILMALGPMARNAAPDQEKILAVGASEDQSHL